MSRLRHQDLQDRQARGLAGGTHIASRRLRGDERADLLKQWLTEIRGRFGAVHAGGEQEPRDERVERGAVGLRQTAAPAWRRP